MIIYGHMPPKSQLLKWVGNKHKFAPFICSRVGSFNRYFEPFLGSGAVLGHVAPKEGYASDAYKPLIDIWQTVASSPRLAIKWYADRYDLLERVGHKEGYELIKRDFNVSANGADLLFISRTCYGGVIRFRKRDGYLSTPCGIHKPIRPESFARRVWIWHERIKNTRFEAMDYKDAIEKAGVGDLVYCDPPYIHSQAILYGGQDFRFPELVKCLEKAIDRGAKVALSIDGIKKSGKENCHVEFSREIFPTEIFIPMGASMLKRFQRYGENCYDEHVDDRLLLSW